VVSALGKVLEFLVDDQETVDKDEGVRSGTF
jgi:hypothetical protein